VRAAHRRRGHPLWQAGPPVVARRSPVVTPYSLGGQVDRSNAHKYRLDGEHSSSNGEQCDTHDRQQGGGAIGGAIDLVMPGTGYNVRAAIAHLAPEIGTDATLAAATWHGARHANNDVREIIERGERPAFRAPDADADAAR